ncbi:DNA repair endonuclease XPF [Trichodelitschia bisporula]|uniref:DNA repair endonuclease XPF n=1 Tax=Trichodelitschia bisporula TaxID=703511 RepID=A0A6G1I8C9_9PEZI|nr:DNA repair endonuclease XPF [Trichodelitschia bisporula]
MSAEELPPVKLSLPLEFQQEIFRELRSEDELLIMARGLGLLRIVTNFLHSCDAAGNNLILIIGADDRENEWIGESLAEHATISRAPKCRGLTIVSNEAVTIAARAKMYANSGIFSITSRILIVDFLSEWLDPAIVSGIVVLHAEKVVATALEAFILRVYRQKNKDGFLKAFSDVPESFTYGISPLATMMRNLFLRKPSLYPRFHVEVANSLYGKKKVEVIELEVDMTDSMRSIQNAIMECIEASISELKKGNSGLEMDDWNLDNALHRNFQAIVMRQLDPVWHRTSPRTKQIVRDLGELRQLLFAVLTYDAVKFNQYLDTIVAAAQPPPGKIRQNPSPWLLLDAAETMFEAARRRVYTGKLSEKIEPVLEEQPKWEILAKIIEEIEQDMYFHPTKLDDSSDAILVMCGDQAACSQIREYLQSMHKRPENANEELKDDEPSAAFMMRRRLRNYLTWKRSFTKVSASLDSEIQKAMQATEARGGPASRGRAPPSKRRRVRGSAAAASGPSRPELNSVHVAGDKDAHIAALLSNLEVTEVEAQERAEIGIDPLEGMEDYYELYDMKDLVVVHPFDGDMDDHLLEEIKPRYIILYEPDLAFIRRVEVYRSCHTDRSVRVYFMYYSGSVEEQRYLGSSRREKDAFTKLIRERGNMAMTIDTANLNPEETFLRTINTRIAGGGRIAATTVQPRVVVDVREFSSSLPSLLHGRGMEILPCMLTVGDYILTPKICIERKSVSDLIGSFANGRLFNQAEQMSQHYENPMLLIEFDQNKSFTLEPFADLSSAAAATMAAPDLQGKLVMLTIAFPRLRIIWSSSPYQTAEIFEELKKLQEEPDPVKAVQIGLEEGEDAESGAVSQTPMDMLRVVPGITDKNLYAITAEVENIQELANMEEEALCRIMGREVGRKMWKFFNRNVVDD